MNNAKNGVFGLHGYKIKMSSIINIVINTEIHKGLTNILLSKFDPNVQSHAPRILDPKSHGISNFDILYVLIYNMFLIYYMIKKKCIYI